jgi:hypothetical protein
VALSTAKLEAQVGRLADLLHNVISDTKGRVEKKQAQVTDCWSVGNVLVLCRCSFRVVREVHWGDAMMSQP